MGQCGEHNSTIYSLWYANNELVTGVYRATNITGGPHFVLLMVLPCSTMK